MDHLDHHLVERIVLAKAPQPLPGLRTPLQRLVGAIMTSPDAVPVTYEFFAEHIATEMSVAEFCTRFQVTCQEVIYHDRSFYEFTAIEP